MYLNKKFEGVAKNLDANVDFYVSKYHPSVALRLKLSTAELR